LRDIKNRFLRKQAFDAIKSDFYLYVISIPQNAQNMPTLIGEIGYVKRSVLHDYYDKETGFIIKDDKSVVIW
jgi:CRISPR-associated endonuclease/helicase Cas3